MNAAKVRPVRPAKDAAHDPLPAGPTIVPESDLDENPVDIINDRLGQAHATLDLIYTMISAGHDGQGNLDELCKDTLNYALHGAMLRINEAMEAAKGCVSHG